MIKTLAIIISLVSIGWAFFSPIWAWSPLMAVGILLLVQLFGIKLKKWPYVEELSPSANEMLQKHGPYYSMPFAGRDFSAAASVIQGAAIAVGAIGAFKGFYWGIGGAIVFWFVFGPVAMAYDPTNFIRGTHLEAPHDEVVAWIRRRLQQSRG